MNSQLPEGNKSYLRNENQLKGATVEPSPQERNGRYVPAINIYNGVDSYSRRPIVQREIDPDGNVMSYDDALAVSKQVAAETARRLGGKTDDVRTHVYDEDFSSTYPDDSRSNYVEDQPKRKAKSYKKVQEFEVIHAIIALVIVVVVWFGISAYQTKARCEQSPDFVTCLTQDISR